MHILLFNYKYHTNKQKYSTNSIKNVLMTQILQSVNLLLISKKINQVDMPNLNFASKIT